MRRSLDTLVDRLFDPFAETPPLEPGLALSFPATATLGQLHRFFGVPAPTWSEETLTERLGAAEQTRMGPFVLSDAGDAEYLRVLVDPLPGGLDDAPVGLARPDPADAPTPAAP